MLITFTTTDNRNLLFEAYATDPLQSNNFDSPVAFSSDSFWAKTQVTLQAFTDTSLVTYIGPTNIDPNH